MIMQKLYCNIVCSSKKERRNLRSFFQEGYLVGSGRPTLKSGGWKMWTVVDEWRVIFLTILGIVCPKSILSKEFYGKIGET